MKKNNFFSHSKNYLIAELFNKGIVFLTIPIFTRLLLPEEYGVLNLVSAVISISTILLGLNFTAGINRKCQEKEKDFFEYLGTNIVFLIFLNVVLLFLGFVFKQRLSSLFSINENLFFMAILIASFNFFIQLKLTYLQGSEQSKKYATFSIIFKTLTIILGLIGILVLEKDKYIGKIYGQLIVAFITSVFVIYSLIKMSKFNLKKEHLRYSLILGIPLIPHALSSYILSQFDRIMINQISGNYETGLYSFAYNIGMIMVVFSSALNKSYVPIFYKKMNDKKYFDIQKLSDKYVKLLLLFALGLILFSKEIIMIMADKKYFVALKIIPIVVIGVLMTSLYTLFVNYSFYRKKTGTVSLFTFVAGFVNIGLNYMFIPKYGYIAAAWTTLVSYVLLFVLHYINSKYILKENVIKLKGIMIGLLILLIVVGGYLSLDIGHYWIDFLIKVGLVIGFVIVIGWKEIKEIKEFLKNRN